MISSVHIIFALLLAAGSIAQPTGPYYPSNSKQSVALQSRAMGNQSTSGAGKCPSGFRNTVFNTAASKQPGWPGAIWNSLTSHGVDKWIGFALQTVDKTATYNTASGPAQASSGIDQAQVHVVMDPTGVSDAVTLVNSAPPQYLELFNEPDYSYMGWTPVTDPVAAAAALQPLFSIPHSQTQYISPALANANSGWLETFRDNCNGCFSQIPIVSAHLYNQDPNWIVGQVTQLHSNFPDQKIWITELAPATSQCSMSEQDIVTWMNTLIPQLVALGYVEKIFWNSGEAGLGSNGLPDNGCNPSLTNPDGSPTSILDAYGAVCG